MLALRAAARRSPSSFRTTNGARLIAIRWLAVVADAPIPKKTKVWDNIDEAVKDVKSGDVLLSGGELDVQRIFFWFYAEFLSLGFGLSGIPESLLKALSKRSDVSGVTAVSNNAGVGEHGLGKTLSRLGYMQKT